MITGSDKGTGHIIEEVVLDFVFDSNVIADEHESLMSTWVVDKLLPTVETALNEYDEKGKVLRIERITIDLGDIPSSNSDFLTRIIPPLYEQLILQLNRARSLGRTITPSSRQLAQPEGHQYQKASADMTVQQINPFQSDLEILDHFLATGNMPWHVDASNSWTHEKLLERVLLDATGGAALRALMVKIPSNRRADFVSRLVKQYSNRALEKLLIQIAPKQHELMLDLTRAYQSVLSALQLPALQQAAALQQLWAQIFKTVVGHAHALDSFDFSDAMPQILQKLTIADLPDQNTLIDKLIFVSKKHLKDSRLPVILTNHARKSKAGRKSVWNFLRYFKVTKTYGDQKTVNDGGSLFGKTALMPEKDLHFSYSAVLFKQIKAALQQTEIDETGLFLENLHATNSLTIQKQLFEMLQDKVIRKKLIARLPSFILLDIAYLLSVQAAIIIEQLLPHAVKFHQLTADQNHMTIAEWERQFWENALSFLVSGSLKTSFEATHFVQALVRMTPDDVETVTVLKNWREILVKAQQQEHGALQNIFFIAIATLKPESREIPIGQKKNLVTTGLATDSNYPRRQREATVETGFSKQANPDQTKVTKQQSVAQSAADLASQSFEASTFSYEIANGQSADEDKAPVLQPRPEALQHQEHKNRVGTNTLSNISLDAMSTGSSVSRSFLANQEIKLIIAALETDYVAQRQRLEMASKTGSLAPEKLPDEMLKAIVHAVLKHDPALTDADKHTFIEAIESHARKAGSSSLYYQQVMKKLLSDETIDLEDIALRAARHDSPRADSDMAVNTEVAEKKRSVQNKKTSTDILERILFALRQVAKDRSGMQISDIQIRHLQTIDTPSVKKQLLKYLKDKARRTQLIMQLPQPVLLDISYLLSPQAAIMLEQLMLYSETLHNKTPNRLHARVAGWEHQVWENALEFFVRTPQERLLADSSDLIDFVQTLVSGLSDSNDSAAILKDWREVLMQEQGQVKTVLQNLIFDAIASSKVEPENILTRQPGLPHADTVIFTKSATAGKQPPILDNQTRETTPVVYQRIQSALKQFAETGADVQTWQLQTTDIPSAKKQLLKYLKDKTRRTQLIMQLPQSVLLDISYLLSPHTAIMLEQLMLYSETLHNKTPNRLHAGVSGWEHQIWENALGFFVHKPPNHLFEDLFDAASFLRGLVYNLSGDNDTAAILTNWHEILKQEHGHEIIVLHNVLVEAISASHVAPQNDLSGEQMRQIADTLTRDFERGYRQLETAFHSGQLTPGKLTGNALKPMIRALLKHDPALTGDDSQTFINAIETHAQRAENIALYYQQILEKLLSDQAVDLESIVSRSVDVSDPVLTGTDLEQRVVQSASAAAVICQRIRSALIQSTITGTDLFLQLSPTADAQTIQKHVLDLLQQTQVRTQIIAKLPKSILFDMIYLLSPQATLVIEQLLSNAKMLFQFTPKKHAAHVDEWEREIWENSFGYLLALPVIDASAGCLNTLAFIHAVIDKLSESKDTITVIQSWHNALTKMHGVEYGQDHGTRILRHSIETLLMQQKSGLGQEPERSFHPQPLKIRNDTVAEQVLPNKMAEMDNEVEDGDEFYIHNAGQVLAAPYLPQLFKLLGLIEKGVFVNRSAAERAVHLLQFMVNEETRSPEYQLLLNKLLCGLSTVIPISSEIEISRHEQETIENLIQGMIRNWKTIGNTSVQGLRETFLQRNGRLLLKDEMWFLTIEPGPFDMLLDQLPWSFSVIKHSWMERAIHVTWR